MVSGDSQDEEEAEFNPRRRDAVCRMPQVWMWECGGGSLYRKKKNAGWSRIGVGVCLVGDGKGPDGKKGPGRDGVWKMSR